MRIPDLDFQKLPSKDSFVLSDLFVSDNEIEFLLPDCGLGTHLMILSALMATDLKIHAYTWHKNNPTPELLRIFKIPENKFRVSLDPGIVKPHFHCDNIKRFSPYLEAESVNLFNNDFKITKSNKPCIALAMHHGSGLMDFNDPQSRVLPFNRYASPEIYNQIYKLILAAGYDPIVINRTDIDLEQKTYILNELCEAVICYEGGLAHLAHVLKVPTIMLPWRCVEQGDTDNSCHQDLVKYSSHIFQQDRKTWFLDTQEEISDWTANILKDTIDKLHNDQGNSIYFDTNMTIDYDSLKIFHKSVKIDFNFGLSDWEKEFIKKYTIPEKFGQIYKYTVRS
jgi:hypothetical protein